MSTIAESTGGGPRTPKAAAAAAAARVMHPAQGRLRAPGCEQNRAGCEQNNESMLAKRKQTEQPATKIKRTRAEEKAAAQAEKKTKAAAIAKERQDIHRLKGKLFLALQCIFLQDDDDIWITLGRKFASVDCFKDVLSAEDRYGVVVGGHMTQGRALPTPEKGTMSAEDFRTDDHTAACVQTNWIYAHMFMMPYHGYFSADFKEAVRLVRRASETMCRVSYMISQAAHALAEKLDCASQALDADLAAEAALVPEHALQVSFPRLPHVVTQWFRFRYDIVAVARKDKDEARIAFEETVADVFSFGVCIARESLSVGIFCHRQTQALR